MNDKYETFNNLVSLQRSLKVDPNLFKRTLINSFEKEELIGFIIEDLITSNWSYWFRFLQDLTGCIVVPSHHCNDYKLMTDDWQTWYKNTYCVK